MEYFNMNPKFIRHGGRKAPVGTIQQLADVLDAGLPPIPDHKKGPHLESMTSVVLLDMRFGEAADIIDNFGIGKVSADLHRFVGWCLEVNFEELGIAENGVPYLLCSSSVEGGAPFVFFSTVMERQSGPTFPIMGTCLRFPGLNPSPMRCTIPWRRSPCSSRRTAALWKSAVSAATRSCASILRALMEQ